MCLLFLFEEGLELCLILEKWRISRCFWSQVLRLPHKVRFVFLFSENGTRKKANKRCFVWRVEANQSALMLQPVLYLSPLVIKSLWVTICTDHFWHPVPWREGLITMPVVNEWILTFLSQVLKMSQPRTEKKPSRTSSCIDFHFQVLWVFQLCAGTLAVLAGSGRENEKCSGPIESFGFWLRLEFGLWNKKHFDGCFAKPQN